MSLPRVLAVDCGAGHVACGAITVDKTGRLSLEKIAVDAFNPDPSLDAGWADMLATALAESPARSQFAGTATLGLPGHHILGKFIKTPLVEESKRAKIVQFEAQQNIPYALDEVIWDYQVVSEQGLDLELMLAAAKRDIVDGACAALAGVGMGVASVLPSSVALTRCFRYNYPEVTGGVMIADIGARSTNLIFMDAERYFVRTIPLAGNTITQAIAEELKHDFTHCETLKVQVLSGGSDLPAASPARLAVGHAATSFVSKLHLEITRSVVNYRRQSNAEQPTRLFLTGGGSLLPDLAQALQDKLKVTVEALDPLRNVAVGPAAADAVAYAPMLAGMIGLHAPALSTGRSLNLLPERIAKQIAFKKRQPMILAAAALVTLSCFPALVQYGRTLEAARKQLAAYQEAIRPLQVIQDRVAANTAAIEAAKVEIAGLQSLAESKNNWINFFSDLQDRLVKVEDVWLEQLSVLRPGAGGDGMGGGGGGGLFGGMSMDAPVEPEVDPVTGEPVKPVLRLQMSGRLLDRKNPVTRVSPDSYERVKRLLASFVDSQFISAVERESFDPNTPGILRFDFTLVIDPARPL